MERSEPAGGYPKLSDRLNALAAMVSPGNRLADVGCDHGYIPIALCLAGKIPSAVAMDINEGPLSRAREHIAEYGLEESIEARRSDGIGKLGEDEADTVLVAGMGGLLIVRILTERDIPVSVTELVLSPHSEVSEVRRCVRELGFSVADEDMVLEDGKFYPIIKAVRDPAEIAAGEERDSAGPGQQPEPEQQSESERQQELEDAFGPVLLRERNPVLRTYLEGELNTTDSILSRLESVDDASGREVREARGKELEYKRELLLSALKEMTDS